MNTLNLSSDSRSQLTWQVSQNGTFPHPLHNENGVSCATAYVVIEQCARAVSVRVELGDSVNTITLAHRKNTAERVALYLEELANGVSLRSVPEVDEYLLVSGMESVLLAAVRLRKGTYHLPADGIEHLDLLLHPSNSDPSRTVFRFELDSVGLTLPLLLPNDRVLAYELLSGCVQELIANYRCAA
ncbi:hypothetical protein EJA72_27180 [Pseudomonas sp. PB120]|uniref:hypothetical protein n=1 Tax=Pseudomonas sp. PB120 TaxID=2494700 RepID=UPI0012FD59FC|nr:hypothetical protein [Pseudomonas sp. PB120]MVV51895.1 hypothetical protein [Pseudomonas sp. PB120]